MLTETGSPFFMILNEKSSELDAYVKPFESFGKFYLLIACLKFDPSSFWSSLLEGIMSAGLFLPFPSTAFWRLCIHWRKNIPVAFGFVFPHQVCCVWLSYVTSHMSIQKWYLTASWFWSLQKPYSGWLDFLQKAQVCVLPCLLVSDCSFLKQLFSLNSLLVLLFGVSVLVCFFFFFVERGFVVLLFSV